MNEKKLKHLEMIQVVINRMAANSFQLKGWCVTLVTGVLFFSSTVAEEKENLLLIAILPAITFWILDGYFLWQERIFRRTYDIVRQKAEDNIDFKMFEQGTKKHFWFEAFWSLTLIIFYLGLILAILALKYCLL